MIAVADTFDALTSDRPERCGRDPEHACAVLWAGRGVQWLAEFVDMFIDPLKMQLAVQLAAAYCGRMRISEAVGDG